MAFLKIRCTRPVLVISSNMQEVYVFLLNFCVVSSVSYKPFKELSYKSDVLKIQGFGYIITRPLISFIRKVILKGNGPIRGVFSEVLKSGGHLKFMYGIYILVNGLRVFAVPAMFKQFKEPVFNNLVGLIVSCVNGVHKIKEELIVGHRRESCPCCF